MLFWTSILCQTEEKSVGLSIVVPMRNAEHTIQWTVQSVSALQNASVEVVFVNDASTDRTVGVLRAALREYCPGCVLLREDEAPVPGGVSYRYLDLPESRGPLWARYRGLELCSWELVLFLDADDAVGSPSLALQLQRSQLKYKWDVLFSGVTLSGRLSGSQTRQSVQESPPGRGLRKREEVLNDLLDQGRGASLRGKVFSAQFCRRLFSTVLGEPFLKASQLLYAEDVLIAVASALNTHRIVYAPQITSHIHYLNQWGKTADSAITAESALRRCTDTRDVVQFLLDFVETDLASGPGDGGETEETEGAENTQQETPTTQDEHARARARRVLWSKLQRLGLDMARQHVKTTLHASSPHAEQTYQCYRKWLQNDRLRELLERSYLGLDEEKTET